MKKLKHRHKKIYISKALALLLMAALLVNSSIPGVWALAEASVLDGGGQTVYGAKSGETANASEAVSEEAQTQDETANDGKTDTEESAEAASDTSAEPGADESSDMISENTEEPSQEENEPLTEEAGAPEEAVMEVVPIESENGEGIAKERTGVTVENTEISVGKTAITSLSNPKKGKMSISYNAVSNAAGYQIQISKTAAFTDKQSYLSTKTTVTIQPLVQNRTYYVRVRAYKLNDAKKKVYGDFTGVKTIEITRGCQELEATTSAVTIKSVKLISPKKVRIKATVSGVVKSPNKYYYLFAMTPNATALGKNAQPIARTVKKTSLVFTVPLNYNTSSSLLQMKFVVGVKRSNSSSPYKKVSKAKYISNPQKLATSRCTFPTASTKKGLQVNEAYISDAVKLGVKHTTYNICLDDIFVVPSAQNTAAAIEYQHNGKTYWFNKSVIQSYDRTLNAYKENNMIVSAIILMRYRSDLTHLLHNSTYRTGYYALNTTTQAARDQLEAVFTYLAQRYAATGKIANWIIGNEVNNYTEYQYTGTNVLSTNAKIYTNSFRLAYLSIRSVYSKARLYISLDHLWNTLTSTEHTSKQFLNKFAKFWDSLGTFNIAYHAYPSPLTSPAFWTNSNGALTDSVSSPCVNMGNIEVLTNYVKKKFGSSTRIILSEQGFTSKVGLINAEKEQAAAIAYAYYIAEFNDMIDAFIVHRHVDHQTEVVQGLSLGLWTNKAGTINTMGTKKYAYRVFRYMDTSKCTKVTKFALAIIGKKSWKKAVSGYTKTRFK